jgi:hypothetical protein
MSITIRRRFEVKTVTGAVCLLIYVLSCAEVCGNTNVLTFFGWSDQHVKADGDGAHLAPVIDAMNTLSDRPFPANIGGSVDEPDFVIGLGDITEWPTRAAKDTYEQLITGHLRFPSYDVAGNHDSGGSAPSPTIHNWLSKRHGSLSYTFSKKGVHFVALCSKYDESLNSPAQPISKDALEYLRTSLSKVPKNAPIVVATHLCFESITNRDEFVDAFGDANVILVLGGHYHKASVNRHRGINFVQLPSPAPGSRSEFTIIRIDSERLLAIPFDYEKGKWSNDPKNILDARIKGPGKMSVSRQFALDGGDTVKGRSLLLDTHFGRGFVLSYPDSRQGIAVEAVLELGDSNDKPIWRLCQWGTRHSLAKARCIHHANGDISCGNGAKRVLVGAEDSANRDLILEIKGSVEYGMAREAYSPELHAAQFQMFLVVKNVNKQSKDCGNYYWFGVPFYDSRYDTPPSHKAKDGGKADATGKFIYTVAGEHVNAEHLKENKWAEIDADLLPHIKAGLEEAVKRGYLASSNLGDYGIMGINMGWELPGTFDASMQIRGLGIRAVLR